MPKPKSEPKPKRGRPPLPDSERGRMVHVYLRAPELAACERRGKTVQDGLRAIIRDNAEKGSAT